MTCGFGTIVLAFLNLLISACIREGCLSARTPPFLSKWSASPVNSYCPCNKITSASSIFFRVHIAT